MNPFEHVKNLHTKKRRWEDFNDEEKKSFNVFIINKTLSFNPNYLNIVNLVQNYTGLNQVLSQKEVFNLYYSLLPTKFRFYRWIKGAKTKKDKDTSKKRRESRKDKQFLRDTAIPFNTQLSLPFMEAKHEKKRRK